MGPQSESSLPLTVAAALQQRAVELECCGDTGVPAAQEGAALAAAYKVTECSPSDGLPQTGQRDGLDSEGLHRYGGEGCLGTPGKEKVLEKSVKKCLYCFQNVSLMPRLSCTCEKEGLVFSVTFLVQNIFSGEQIFHTLSQK